MTLAQNSHATFGSILHLSKVLRTTDLPHWNPQVATSRQVLGYLDEVRNRTLFQYSLSKLKKVIFSSASGLDAAKTGAPALCFALCCQ